MLAVFGAALVWLLTKGKAAVMATVYANGVVSTQSPDGTVTFNLDSVTGAQQFDSTSLPTYPPGWNDSVDPLAFPVGSTDPKALSCPIGYALWKDVATGKYLCAKP